MKYKNNFDFLRLTFATFVLISHSFSLGNFPTISNFSIGLGEIRVYSFFVISGYLVTGSLEKTHNPGTFFKKRALRLFPGLIVMSLFVTIILGFVTQMDKVEYFTNPDTYLHFFSTISLIPIHKCLPGVFQNNPSGCAVNGSLWTIRYEILFYIILSGMYLFQNRKRAILIILGLFIINLYLWHLFRSSISEQWNYHLGRLFNLGTCFAFGAALKYVPSLLNRRNLIFSILILIMIMVINDKALTHLLIPLILPVIIISIGNSYVRQFTIPAKFGDISYGLYIYAYPTQQSVIQLLYPKSVSSVIFLTIAIAGFLGYLSWHLVEKKFKPRNSNTIR
jgi:peptidoglycan/LPS O-acetylase OafA/YrhL